MCGGNKMLELENPRFAAIIVKMHSSNQWLLSLREFDEERDTCEVFMCFFLVKLFISCKAEKET